MFLFISLAQKNVIRKKERSVLTIIGVILAVASTISLVSIAEGLYQRLNHEINLQAVDIYVLPKSSSFLPAGSLGAMGSGFLTLSRAYIPDIEKIDGISDVTGISRLLTSVGEDNIGVVVWGISPDKMKIFYPQLFDEKFQELKEDTLQMVVGPRIADELNIKVGDEFPISEKKFLIVGKTIPVSSFEDYACFIPIKEALEIQKLNGVQEIWIKLKDPSLTDSVLSKLEQIKGVSVKTKSQYLTDANHFIGLVRLLQYAISAIGILIAITAAMNTMLMSTYERMSEFGTLRAIGASRFFIFGMVLFESLFLAIIGGVLGVLLGFLGSSLFNDAIMAILNLSFPVSTVSLKLVMEALFLSIGVGLLGAFIPAFIASRMDIIKALKWE